MKYSRWATRITGLAAACLMAVSPYAMAAIPEGVSPGAADRFSTIRGECPAFSWGMVDGTSFYELVVYELAQDLRLEDGDDLDLNRATEVLFSTIPGGATSWTPELDRCLSPGGRYVWFVRAVYDEADGVALEAGGWSEGLFFSVAVVPSMQDVEQALSVLERYLEYGGDAGIDVGLHSRPVQPATRPGRAGGSATKAAPHSVLTATAAIRGLLPDNAGEAYGVIGTSASPNGAGLGAVNTAGGPDLVLDGSANGAANARLSESGIDRPSPEPQTFTIENTAGGGVTLEVDGIEVVTTATDRDTMAGLSCAGNEVAKWDGAAWSCENDRDTLGAVKCGPFSNRVAKWNGSGWSCAADQNTVYTAGPGLIIDGNEIRLDPAAFAVRIYTWGSSDVDGRDTSLAIGADGLGLISYYNATDDDLMVFHCKNIYCSSATHLNAVDSVGDVGAYSSLAIGADGLGLIAYRDSTNDDLKIAHCDDVFCTSATITTLDDVGVAEGPDISLAIGVDGFGLISYFDSGEKALKVAHCENALCTSVNISTLDSGGLVGRYSSLAIGADGLGLITYHDNDLVNRRIKVAHCDDLECTSASLTTLWFPIESHMRSSLAIGSDGLGLITWGPGYSMYFFHCNDAACTSATLSNAGDYSVVEPSLAIGSDGLPMMSFQDGDTDHLAVARCDDILCTTALVTIVDDTGNVGSDSSIAFGINDHGLISYYDWTNQDLKVVHLPYGL